MKYYKLNNEDTIELLQEMFTDVLTMDNKAAYLGNVAALTEFFVNKKNNKIVDKLVQLECWIEETKGFPLYPDFYCEELLGTNLFNIDMFDVYMICYDRAMELAFTFLKDITPISIEGKDALSSLQRTIKNIFTEKENCRDPKKCYMNKTFHTYKFDKFLLCRGTELEILTKKLNILKTILSEESNVPR